jgi:hypothetical protein
MVIRTRQRPRGYLSVDLMVALSLLMLAVIPLAYSVTSERRLARIYYWQAVSMEIVDGELEALKAGEWRGCEPGTHPYKVRARSASNLPPGQFTVTRGAGFIRLEWIPARKHSGPRIVREARL